MDRACSDIVIGPACKYLATGPACRDLATDWACAGLEMGWASDVGVTDRACIGMVTGATCRAQSTVQACRDLVTEKDYGCALMDPVYKGPKARWVYKDLVTARTDAAMDWACDDLVTDCAHNDPVMVWDCKKQATCQVCKDLITGWACVDPVKGLRGLVMAWSCKDAMLGQTYGDLARYHSQTAATELACSYLSVEYESEMRRACQDSVQNWIDTDEDSNCSCSVATVDQVRMHLVLDRDYSDLLMERICKDSVTGHMSFDEETNSARMNFATGLVRTDSVTELACTSLTMDWIYMDLMTVQLWAYEMKDTDHKASSMELARKDSAM